MDPLGQLVGGERLLEERAPRRQQAVLPDRLLRVSRDVQHLQVRRTGEKPLHQRGTAEAGHDDVGEDEIERTSMPVHQPQGIAPVARLQHPISPGPQHPTRQASDRQLVLHHQHGARRPRLIAPPGQLLEALARSFHSGEIHREGAPVVQPAVDPDVPAALPDDPVHRGEAEPGAAAQLLGREEGLEEAGQGALVHPHPVVAHAHFDQRAHQGGGLGTLSRHVGRIHVGGADGERAARGHRVPGVHRQVGDHLLQLARIRQDLPQVGLQLQPQVHVLADEPPQHRAHVGHHAVQVHHPGLEHLLPAEREQLAHQGRGPVRGPIDLQEVESPRVLRLDLPHQQLGVADDGGEEVVEVVRHAAGEPAHRLHLLRLTQLLLEGLPLGHVADVDQEVQRSAGGVLHRRGVRRDPDRAAVAPEQPHRVVGRADLAAHQLPQLVADRRQVLGVGHLLDGPAPELRLAVAQQLGELRGHLEPATVQRDVRGHDQRDALRPLELLPALPERPLDAEPLERAAAVIRQGLQHGEVAAVVRVGRVALDRENAGDPMPVTHGDEHERCRRAVDFAEGREALDAGRPVPRAGSAGRPRPPPSESSRRPGPRGRRAARPPARRRPRGPCSRPPVPCRCRPRRGRGCTRPSRARPARRPQ